MTDPLVSFVVPSYNLAQYLRECIESLLAQQYSNFEILVLDNASPDDTRGVASSFRDERLTYIRQPQNIGAQANFNFGIMRARGELVWLVSADDALQGPQALGAYVDVMSDQSVGFAFSRGTYLGVSPSTLVEWADLGDEDARWQPPALLRILLERNRIVMSSVVARRDALVRVGMHRVDLPHAADWYLWCRLARFYAAAYIAKPMVGMRVHEGTFSAALAAADPEAFINDELAVLWSLRDEIGGARDLRRVCDESIAARLVRVYAGDATKGPALDDRAVAAVERRVRERALGDSDVRSLLGLTIQRSADSRYWTGDRAGAVYDYRLALRLGASRFKVGAKLALVRLGGLGLFVRRLARRLRQNHTTG